MTFWEKDSAIIVRWVVGLSLFVLLLVGSTSYSIYYAAQSYLIKQIQLRMDSMLRDRELMTRMIFAKHEAELKLLSIDEDIKQFLLGTVSNTDLLQNKLNANPSYPDWILADASGEHYTVGGKFPKEYKDRLIRQAKQMPNGASFILERAANGERVYLLGQTILSDGKIIGTLLMADRFRMLDELFSDTNSLGKSGESFIADNSGYTLTRLHYDFPANHAIDVQAMNECLSGKQEMSMITPDYTGEPTVMSFQQVKNYGGCIMVHIHADEALSPIKNLRYQLLGVNSALLISVGLLAFLTSRRLIRDAATRKKDELSLLQHKIAIDTTHDGFWIVNLQGKITGANKAYAEMSGYSIDEIVGMSIPQFEAQMRPDEVKARIDMIMSQGWAVFETRHRHKDGHAFDIEVSVSFMPETQEMVAFMRDIRDRKIAENEMRIASTAFETHEAIMITDANANIIRVNQAFQNITGYSLEEVFGKNPRILSSGKHDKTFYEVLWKQLFETGSWEGEIWDKRKNGQIYPKWLTITAVKDKAGVTTEYVAIFSDITSRKQAEEEIYGLAFYDMLTKLPNRRFLLDRIQQARSVSARSNLYGALLFLDMDKFKTLNDTLGHDYGDLFLIEIAQRLKHCVREVNTVARIGGDEFVVLIEEIGANAEESSQKVAVIAEKIRASLSSPYQLKEREHHSSPSIGVSLYHGNDESESSLLKHADMAMYQAKDSGGNAVRFFDPAMQLAVEVHAALEADMRHAVPENQLRLFYQIQLDSDLRPLGAEALIRWLHPVRGMVSPLQFIPIAEESSLILEIGHWVLETACKQLALWSNREQTKNLTLAINVSAQQFKRHDFVDTIMTMLNIHQVNPNLLKLELTESVVLSDVADVVAKMHALKALGVRLSLDDFGTGYSSLSYLKQLPLDQIKIDQSFIRDITTDPNDAVMVQTIIGLANNFRLNVIAEGVETEVQLNFLKQNGCMAYQGYLFSRPVPIDEFEALLK